MTNKRCGFLLFCLMFVLLFAASALPVAAGTAAGTVISETVTASYTNAALTVFNATGNTVTTTVQNTPSLTITDPGAQNVTRDDVVIDTFTLTNTGNNAGKFALTADATFGGTALSPTLMGYIINGATSGTCSTIALCATYSTLNTQIQALASTAVNGTLTVGVQYQAFAGATAGQTIQPSITANIAYVAGSGTLAETSSNVTNVTYSDTVMTDARLDMQTTVVAPSTYTSTISWTVKANNGGGNPALNLTSAQTLLGAAAAGLAIFVPMPVLGGTYLPLIALPTTPTVSGDTVTLYYNGAACSTSPISGWSTPGWATAKCVAIYLSGGAGGAELVSAPSGSTAGAGAVTTAQVTLNFVTNQPSGTNSGNVNSTTLRASSAIGGTVWATGSTPILGQGVTIGTVDAATASLLNGIQANATASSGTTAPGGASNVIATQAYDVIPQVGPLGAPAAMGSYNGVVAVNSADSFTAVGFTPAGGAALVNTGTVPGTPIGNVITTSGVTTVNVPNAFTYEEVSAGGTLTLSGNAPAPWTVQICQDSGGPVCTASGIWTTINSPGSTSSSILTLSSLQTLTNYKFWAVFTLASASNVTAFSPLDALITANDGTTSTAEATHDELYPGFVPLTRSVTVSSTGCPAGVTPAAGGVCPGGVLIYTIDYRNLVLGGNASGSTEPASAFPQTAPGTLQFTENGAYLAYTNGLNAMLVSGANGTTTFGDSTANSTFAGNVIGSTNFTDTVGGASFNLVPVGLTGANMGSQGTFTFQVVVK